MYEKKNIDYKLEGLKFVKEKLEKEDTVVVYRENCSPDPYGHNRKCDWSYPTVEYNMTDYPCPWDTKLLYKNKFKSNSFSSSGCFYRCLLKDSKIKAEYIVKDKIAYLQAMDTLINILESDEDWRITLNKQTLLTKESRSLLYKSKDKRKKMKTVFNDSETSLQVAKEIATKVSLQELAEKIINYVKSKDISVLRYDSKSSRSIYLKFDYGMAGSLRLSDSISEKDIHYTFNILSCIFDPYKETVVSTQGRKCDTYFYPYAMGGHAALDIYRFRNYRVRKYGQAKYKELVEKYKTDESTRKGFWQNAKLV